MANQAPARGISLIEVLIASAIFILALVPFFMTLVVSMEQIALSREVTIANDDAKDVLERLKTIPFPDITTQYPNNSHPGASVVGGFMLPDEDITISYPAGTGAVPLAIEVTVTWTTRKGTPRSDTYRTARTQLL
jgi:Tfp pilus assembly protein PilV